MGHMGITDQEIALAPNFFDVKLAHTKQEQDRALARAWDPAAITHRPPDPDELKWSIYLMRGDEMPMYVNEAPLQFTDDSGFERPILSEPEFVQEPDAGHATRPLLDVPQVRFFPEEHTPPA
jgi:hypothetical protein